MSEDPAASLFIAFHRNVGKLYHTTRRHIPNDCHHRENLKTRLGEGTQSSWVWSLLPTKLDRSQKFAAN